MNNYFAHSISTWTLPGGVSCNDDDDQNRLERFLTRFPQIADAIAHSIGRGSAMALPTPPTPPPPLPLSAPTPPVALAASDTSDVELQALIDEALRRRLPQQSLVPQFSAPPRGAVADDAILVDRPLSAGTPTPKRPTRLSAARVSYNEFYNGTLKKQGKRTSEDKQPLFDRFAEFLRRKHPELGNDPWVHEIDASHISEFLKEESQRKGKRIDPKGEAESAAPRTMLKKLSDFNHLFGYLKTKLKATLEDIAADMGEAAEAWQSLAAAEDVHYAPFTNGHIQRIFDSPNYLTHNRDPDYFWLPLLGLHLGVRLGDVVATKLEQIGHIPEIDTWYIDIPVHVAKNNNSVRRLPITEPLIRLGFLKYVEHVRSLGAQHLFPHRDWTTKTAERDPSKSASRKFGQYLDEIGIQSPDLVFHSFRHTVITVLQDSGVPLSHAMQICGHEAQDYAVKTGRITETQARSVHQKVYTHADLARMGTDYPILALRDALERSIKPPIDYERLAVTAEIVREHTKQTGRGFCTGWPPQKSSYTERMLARLHKAGPGTPSGPRSPNAASTASTPRASSDRPGAQSPP